MIARVAVVTGASRGLGRGIANSLAEAGCDVIVNWATSREDAERTAALVEARGRRAVLVAGDVGDPATSDALVDAATQLGDLEVWVNNAGISVLAPIVETDPADLERMLAVNVMGTFHGMRAAARWMLANRRGGRIINVASDLGVQAAPLLGAYSASKFAVVGLTQAAAVELAPAGITVNAIGPGTAETDMVTAERASESSLTNQTAAEVRQNTLDAVPAGRFCRPEDAGSLVAWLASSESSYLTGQTLLVNGGSVLH
jgi:meso-butanediol dehydrogenase/(S,S)-butanediol dehydrogenase/diacetyl reductase